MVIPDHPALRELLRDPDSKLDRGLQNDATAELLSAVDWDWKDPMYVFLSLQICLLMTCA